MIDKQIIEHMWKIASNDPNHDSNWYDPVVIAFANLVAQHEREECAKLVESSIYDWKIDATNPHEWDELAFDLSNAIVNRTRGQE